MQAGSATRVINCEIGDDLVGQLHRRIAERIRDDLEANLLYLADDDTQVLIASLDLCGLFDTAWIRNVCGEIEAATGVPARHVILANTHTHTGPTTAQLLHDSPTNGRYLANLRDWLVEAATEAVESARPARAGWASGHAHIGYNRRLCWADGSHTMYGDSSRPEFAGVEGPDDPEQSIFFVVDEDDRCLALAHNNCCHMTCVEGATFVSADWAGEARRLLREALDDDGLPILYLQGASADTSPWDMLARPVRYDGERRLREIGATLCAETLRLIREADVDPEPVLRHAFRDLEIATRQLTPEQVAHALTIRDQGVEKAGRGAYVLAVDGTLRLHEAFRDHPVDTLAIHALRIGDFAIVTNPCELYCQFGLDIKRRSPAAVTAVTQLADGFSGYCPTVHAVHGGGYSAAPTYWTRLEPEAGYRIVEAAGQLLHQVFH